jgi:hypothetical protein
VGRLVPVPEGKTLPESFYVYLLGQGLSFALLKQGFEPLHGTAVVIDGEAVALVADCGRGKSTLAAAFVKAGHSLLTDDVLMLHAAGTRVMAFPGPARVKLFPKVARALLAHPAGGAAMNSQTSKRVLPLAEMHVQDRPVPLAAIYEIQPPPGAPGRCHIQVKPVAGRDAAIAIVQAAFNCRVVTRPRLARQFMAAASLAERVPMRRLSYPRQLDRLPEVVRAIMADLQRQMPVPATS